MSPLAPPHRRPFPALLAALALLALPSPATAGSIWTFGGCVADDCSGPVPNVGFVAVAAGNYHALGLRNDGSITPWGLCDIGQCDVPFPNIGYEAIAAGDSFSLALRDGVVHAWGGDIGMEFVPQPNSGYVAIAAGFMHALALRADGSIVSWGSNSWGQQVLPTPNSGVVAIAGSGSQSMALRADGSVVKWGCGAAPCELPAPNTGFVAISGHHEYSLAIRGSDGAVVGWGSNAFGQLDVPAPNSGFVEVAAGVNFALGIREDGSVSAWGAPVTMPPVNGGFTDISANSGVGFGVQSTPCSSDAQCDDGAWCTGDETCVGGTCEPGVERCPQGDQCRESDQQCVECLTNSHCDDGIFCNGAETCLPDGTCQPGSNPCLGMACDEGADACVGGVELWMSFAAATAVPGLGTVADEDIVSRNLSTGAWSMVFDGSDVGVGGLVIDGMARWFDGSILLSFTNAGSIPGLSGGPSGTTVDDSDIVRFVPSSLGEATAGSFVFYFDGSDVGLTTDNEDVDAIAIMPNGRLVISTVGSVSVTSAKGDGADLLVFIESRFGSNTAGILNLNIDGSDVGLSDGNENLDAADIRTNGAYLLSTLGNFSVPGVSGADEDIVRFTPTSVGANTAGSFAMFLDLSTAGIAATANLSSVDLLE